MFEFCCSGGSVDVTGGEHVAFVECFFGYEAEEGIGGACRYCFLDGVVDLLFDPGEVWEHGRGVRLSKAGFFMLVRKGRGELHRTTRSTLAYGLLAPTLRAR